MLIYKIFRSNEWADLVRDGETQGAPVDLADGYIHFSTDLQLPGTAEKYFQGAEGLILAAIEADKLSDGLKWEPARDGALFPHLYDVLRKEDILWHRPLIWDAQGRMQHGEP